MATPRVEVIAALCRKEFRQQLPFVMLFVVLFFVNVAAELASEFPDQRVVASTFPDYFVDGLEAAIFTLVICLALTSGLLVREFDEGSIEFIDALPVSRSAVFAVKVSVLAGIVLLGNIAFLGALFFLSIASATSIDPSFHAAVLLPSVMIETLMLAVGLCIGLFASFARQLSWVLVGLFFTALALLEKFMPMAGLLTLGAPAELIIEGQRRVAPSAALWAHTCLGAVSLGGAYLCFVYRRAGTLSWAQRASGWARYGLVIGSLVLIVGLGLLAIEDGIDLGETADVSFEEWTVSTAETHSYQFEYPSNLSDRAAALMERADVIYDEVSKWLPTPDEPIPADLTGTAPGTAGTTASRMIRMTISRTDDVLDHQAILGHETVHVLIDRLSQERLGTEAANGRFFHEGLASYLEHRLFRSPEELAQSRSVAAIMHARDEVQLIQVSNSQFGARRDVDLVYQLGEIFVHGLVSRYGEQAPARVLEAIGRESLTENLEGDVLWRDAFQSAGYSYGVAEEAFYLALDEEVEHHRALIDSLPRLRGGVTESEDGGLQIESHSDFDPPWDVIVRTRRAKNDASREYRYPEEVNGAFPIDADDFPSGAVWYQLGLKDDSGDRTVWESWVRMTL